jgi:hypothetical protein
MVNLLDPFCEEDFVGELFISRDFFYTFLFSLTMLLL